MALTASTSILSACTDFTHLGGSSDSDDEQAATNQNVYYTGMKAAASVSDLKKASSQKTASSTLGVTAMNQIVFANTPATTNALNAASSATALTGTTAASKEDEEDVAFTANRNEDFYISVNFNNPENYKIVKFSISFANRKIWFGNSKFEQGSTYSTIYIKVPATYYNADFTNYTISDITYVDGTSIRNMILDGNETIRIGIKSLRTATNTATFTRVSGGYSVNAIDSSFLQNGVLTIPSEYNGEPVVEIGEYAFAYEDFTEVVIPDTVTKINNRAFYYCQSLERITIGKGVQSTGYYTFYGCKALNYVNYTGTLTDWCQIQFAYNEYLDDYSYDFKYQRYGNPTYYAHDLHIQGQLVAGELVIPEGVTAIRSCAFERCTSITSVVLPESVKTLYSYAFTTCSGIQKVDLGSVEIIGASAFNGCYGLTQITIPKTVVSINGSGDTTAFYVTQKLVKVVNHSPYLSVEAKSSFNGGVALYADVVINEPIFDSSVSGETTETEDTDITTDENGFAWYHKNGESDCVYLIGYSGTETEITIPYTYNGLQVKIYQCALAGNTTLKKVTLSKGFTSVPDRMFAYAGSVEEVILPETVTTICSHAFWDSGLKTLVLPQSCTTIEEQSLNDLDGLTLTIQNPNVTFGYRALCGDTNLTVNFNGTVEQWLNATEDELGSSSFKGVLYWSLNYTVYCNGVSYSDDQE